MKFWTEARCPLPNWAWIGLLLLGLALSAAAFHFDEPTRAAIVEHQGGKKWKKTTEAKVMNAVSKYGDWPQLMGLGLLGLGAAVFCRNRRWTEIVAAALLASTLAGILANASRLTTGRTRPRESPQIEQSWNGPYDFQEKRWLIGRPSHNSFPSGHTATAVGFAAPFLFASPVLGGVMLGGALLIAWSRMTLGAHHLSDVTVSTLLALFVGWFVLRRTQLSGKETLDAVWRKIRERRRLRP